MRRRCCRATSSAWGSSDTAAVAGRDRLEILHFLGRLPEEQVRTDSGAEHRHDMVMVL